ncbi:MAG: hypothetical protein JSS14_04590 [Proteobacteria bacterium]|nr:hypothetical protein [Pseudomonadota bacterium]
MNTSFVRQGCAYNLGAVLAVSLALVQASPAQAADLLFCTGNEVAHYAPGLTFAAQPTTLNATSDFTACPVTAQGVASARIQWAGSGNLSCLGGPSAGSATITWNNNPVDTSTFAYTTPVATRPAGQTVIVLTATINSGRFNGATMTQTLALATPIDQLLNPQNGLLGCLLGGIETLQGPVTMQVISP